jgi:hypothetical protein
MVDSKKLDAWIYKNLGDEWGGSPSPPGTAAKLEFGEMDEGRPMFVATTDGNDGFELWIGYRHKWLFHCREDDARRLAWFIVWDWWIKGTWFGLKRHIWYGALSRMVRRNKKWADLSNGAG